METITSGNKINKICASGKLQGIVNFDETKMISIKYWYYQGHGVNPSNV